MTSRLRWYNSASMAGFPRNGPALFFNAFHMWFDWIPDWELWNAMHVQLSWLLSFTGRRLVACMLPRMRSTKIDLFVCLWFSKKISKNLLEWWSALSSWLDARVLLADVGCLIACDPWTCWEFIQQIATSTYQHLLVACNNVEDLALVHFAPLRQIWSIWTSECFAICWPSDGRGHSPGMSVHNRYRYRYIIDELDLFSCFWFRPGMHNA